MFLCFSGRSWSSRSKRRRWPWRTQRSSRSNWRPWSFWSSRRKGQWTTLNSQVLLQMMFHCHLKIFLVIHVRNLEDSMTFQAYPFTVRSITTKWVHYPFLLSLVVPPLCSPWPCRISSNSSSSTLETKNLSLINKESKN